MLRQRFVLDTSAFTGLSKTRDEIKKHIENLIERIAEAKKVGVSCYVPPSVWFELKKLLDAKGIEKELIEKLDAWTIQKSPSRYELLIPAQFLYEYIAEVRRRIDRGLREGEKAVRSKKPVDEAIRDLRSKYRKAMRQGILDSTEDLDILLLAKELGAGVVTTDEGIKEWAKKWGIRVIDGEDFPRLLQEFLKHLG